MKRHLVAVAVIGFAHVHTPVAAAQDPSPGSVDLAAMLGTSTGGVYFTRVTIGLDLLGALRVTEVSSGARILAAAAGIQIAGPFNAKVGLAETGAGTGTAPAREFPLLTSWSAFVGWQSGRAGEPSWRLLVGPTVYSNGGSANLGATVRADIATRTLSHFALTATGRGSVVSKLTGGATSL